MKKLVAMALGTAMLLSANATPVYGALLKDDDDKVLGGPTAYVYLVLNEGTDTLTATTNFGPSGFREAKAKIYYWLSNIYYYSEASSSSSQSGGVSATVTKKLGGADVLAGEGFHKVVYGDITWTPSTSVGSISSSNKASAQKR